MLDVSTAIAIGAVVTPAGLQTRLIAYLLLVPTFLLSRVSLHLLHPMHRTQVLADSCPNTTLLSLDWVSLGILATGLPLAIKNVGPWFGMNIVFLVGVFVLPRFLPTRRSGIVKLLANVLGGVLFLDANYGGALTVLPAPSTVLGPVATNAAFETAFYLDVVTVAFGQLIVLP